MYRLRPGLLSGLFLLIAGVIMAGAGGTASALLLGAAFLVYYKATAQPTAAPAGAGSAAGGGRAGDARGDESSDGREWGEEGDEDEHVGAAGVRGKEEWFPTMGLPESEMSGVVSDGWDKRGGGSAGWWCFSSLLGEDFPILS